MQTWHQCACSRWWGKSASHMNSALWTSYGLSIDWSLTPLHVALNSSLMRSVVPSAPNSTAVPNHNNKTTNHTPKLGQLSVKSIVNDTRHSTHSGDNNNSCNKEAFYHIALDLIVRPSQRKSSFSNAPTRHLMICVHDIHDTTHMTDRDNIDVVNQNIHIVLGAHSTRTEDNNCNAAKIIIQHTGEVIFDDIAVTTIPSTISTATNINGDRACVVVSNAKAPSKIQSPSTSWRCSIEISCRMRNAQKAKAIVL